jgi:ribulose-5-phosphate 4-epimerase/fuculose-1-phosphate aldolase
MNKKNNYIKELIRISQAVGNKTDYIQGGGGNTSVKLDTELMAVKASGFKLKQISPDEGFVIVKYNMIKNYFENINLDIDKDYGKESGEFLRKSVIESENIKKLRPSVETGFHSVLKKYVIHTHSVYANILSCSKEGKKLVNDIFNNGEYRVAWVPYVNPGFNLTIKIKEVIKDCINKKGSFPDAVFLENHGLIVNSDNIEECIGMHEKINLIIKDHFNLNKFPDIEIERNKSDSYISKTKFIENNYSDKKIFDKDYFESYTLYPDQIVYLNKNLTIEEAGKNPVVVISEEGITYNADYETALTIEETVAAVTYIINTIRKVGLNLKIMTDEQKAFINGWESEKYRKGMIGIKK